MYVPGGDVSTDESVEFGSGGGGSGAGPLQLQSYVCAVEPNFNTDIWAYPRFGGGSGGAGGGRILLSADGTLHLGPSARLLADGLPGRGTAAREGASTDQGEASGGHAPGGRGSGGGIRLRCDAAECLTVEAGARLESSGSFPGGGTIKVFSPNHAAFPTAAASAGRTCVGAPGKPCTPR